MADQTTRPSFTLPFVSVDGLRQNTAVGFALDWGGMAISALVALIGALYYVQSTAVLRPLYDDSYITLTFARNLAEHGKLTFDGVHWSTGATSPLHVVLLATLLKLGAAPFFASMAFGVACQVALAAGVYLLTWSIFRDRFAALCGGCAIALTSYATMDAGNGLETGLFMSLLAFGFASYFLAHTRRARIIPGVLIGLAVLTRPEGIFLIPAVLVYHWIERPQGQPLIEYVKDAVALAGPGCVAFGGMLLLSLAVNGTIRRHRERQAAFLPGVPLASRGQDLDGRRPGRAVHRPDHPADRARVHHGKASRSSVHRLLLGTGADVLRAAVPRRPRALLLPLSAPDAAVHRRVRRCRASLIWCRSR